MYTVSKRMEISAAHHLNLTYESRCCNSHGHNWVITVWARSDTLNENGMVVDFMDIKRLIHGVLDHADINQVLNGINPTAENIARWCVEQIPEAFKAEVQESEGNIAIYEV